MELKMEVWLGFMAILTLPLRLGKAKSMRALR